MKKIIISIILLIILSTIILAHEENQNCDMNLEKYAEQAKEYVNNNPEGKAVKYAKKFLGKNAKVELNVEGEKWHAEFSNGMIKEISKGEISGEDFTVQTTMCTLHDLKEGDLTVKDALKRKLINYKAHGFANRFKSGIAKLFM
ncbi:MAG TPA: hypothetical protein VJG30_01595 [Candidatus Nanoarchaeia archaeon]|nr:hypothetical protein [Candidatus Nanoarchaeia archaeon]